MRTPHTLSLPPSLQMVDLHRCAQLITPLAEWHYREWHALYPDEGLGAFREELARSPDADGLPRSWIALQTGDMGLDEACKTAAADRLAGSISLLAQDLDSAAELTPWVANLWVHPRWRRRGVGSALLAHCVQQAAVLGHGTLYLYTTDQHAFYAQRGWTSLRADWRTGTPIHILQCAAGKATADLQTTRRCD